MPKGVVFGVVFTYLTFVILVAKWEVACHLIRVTPLGQNSDFLRSFQFQSSKCRCRESGVRVLFYFLTHSSSSCPRLLSSQSIPRLLTPRPASNLGVSIRGGALGTNESFDCITLGWEHCMFGVGVECPTHYWDFPPHIVVYYAKQHRPKQNRN